MFYTKDIVVQPATQYIFNEESALARIRMAEDAWNSRDPLQVVKGYSKNSQWRNRSEFLRGAEQIVAFLEHKWQQELDYRLCKELWCFDANRIAVRFAYEWRDRSGNWFRSYGNENWEFDNDGLMRKRIASINDIAIAETDRLLVWPEGPRPLDFPSLSNCGL